MKKNDNCLAGMRCPKCRSLGPFDILSKVWARVHDDGIEDYEGCEWDGPSKCFCLECHHDATVADFTVKPKTRKGKK